MTAYADVGPREKDNSDSDDASIGLNTMMIEEEKTINSHKNVLNYSVPRNSESSSKSLTTTDRIGLVGLVNSGMTCYMNSLLQTLFMTPEFRNALFHWRFEGSPEEAQTSIPYQLQRLFVQLCVTNRTAVSTLGLTTSFGWQSSEVFQQQDIHELCRVMFDALEKKLGREKPAAESLNEVAQGDYVLVQRNRNEHHDLINRLYQGERSDRVRCCVCQSISKKPATFLDIQVPLRPFGLDVKSYTSLDEAFRAMLKPERLDGSDQYYCSHCDKKQDAVLDCVYERMPYLLSLQLMRFTFDPRTGNRIKLNDRVSFPLDDWDLTEFVTPSDCSSTSGEDQLAEPHVSGLQCGAQGDQEPLDEDEAVVCSLNDDQKKIHGTTVNGNLSTWNNTEPIEDEDIELGTDSGANSGVNSPFAASSSASPPHPMDEDPHHLDHESMDHEDGIPNQHPTLTVGQASQLRLSSFAHAATDPLDTDDDDDGFGTGDTQSACSSLQDQHSDRQRFIDASGNSGQPSALLPTTSAVAHSGEIALDRTPTKFAMDGTHNSVNAVPSTKWVYELFSIVVHSGSIGGGHYCAYIKSFTDNQWYHFNDQLVTRATRADLESTFGVEQPSYASRASAYYLMYRRKDPQCNQHFLPENEFPSHIAEMAKEIRSEEAEEEAKRLRASSICRVPIYTRSPITQEKCTSAINLYKDQTVDEATKIAREALLPKVADANSGQCRLVQYSVYNDCLGQSVDYTLWHRSADREKGASNSGMNGSYETSQQAFMSSHKTPSVSPVAHSVCTEEPKAVAMCDTVSPLLVDEFLGSCRILWLEHRLNVPGAVTSDAVENTVWPTYGPKGFTFRVSRIDVAHARFYPPERIWMPPDATLGDLSLQVWKLYTKQSCPDGSFPEEFKQLTVFTDWREPISGLALRQPLNHTNNTRLTDVCTVLYSGSDSVDRLAAHLIDLFPGAIYDFTKHYTENHPGSILIVVDLGPTLDGLPAIAPAVTSIPRLYRFPRPVAELAALNCTRRDRVDDNSVCRLCQTRLLLDRSLYCVEVTICLPTRNEVKVLKLQRELLNSTNQALDLNNSTKVNFEQNLNCSSTASRIVSVPIPSRFHGQDDMHVPGSCSSTARFNSHSSAPRSLSRRRSSSFSSLNHWDFDRNTALPGVSSGPVKDSVPDSKHSSNEYFIVNAPTPNGVHRCPGCPGAVQQYSHRTLIFEPRAYKQSDISAACVPIYRACVDKCVDQHQLSQLLGEYLDVDSKFLELRRSSRTSFGYGSLHSNEEILVSVKPFVDLMDVELNLYVLSLTGFPNLSTASAPVASYPILPEPLKVVCRLTWTVMEVIEVASILLQQVYHIQFPCNRLCLRKCSLLDYNPGPVLDSDREVSSFRNPHQNILLQLMEHEASPDCSVLTSVVSNEPTQTAAVRSNIFLFLRRWYPSELVFSPSFVEITIPLGSNRHECWCATIEKICQECHIPMDRLLFAGCKFPGLVHCLSMEAEIDASGKGLTWIPITSPDFDRLILVNGHVVFFKDASESCKELTPDELQSYRIGLSGTSSVGQKSANVPALTYGPSLPPSYADSTSFNVARRTYEQPLRIYTAE